MATNLAALLYLAAGVLFILALRGLSSPETSRRGNKLGMLGMAIAIGTTLAFKVEEWDALTLGLIVAGIAIGGIIGAIIARRIPMTAMPQLVAAFHSLVGLAAVLVAAAALYAPQAFGIGTVGGIHTGSLVEMSIGVAIGAITFSGSIVAFTKLQGLVSGAPVSFAGQHILNLALGIAALVLIILFCSSESHALFWALTVLAFVLGILIIIPIGGADMPVVISMLNSYSGWAAAGIGFTLENTALIITGALVGSSGAILSYIMCKGMNRSFFNVILGGFGGESAAAAAGGPTGDRSVKQGSAEDAAFILKNAGSVIIVPGYGMAVAQAQHALKEMAEFLKEEGVKVSYAIHPVAGRMPGHMNVLLAEANIPYEKLVEMDEINGDLPTTDVALIIGANDVVNPAARDDPKSAIAGMPIIEADKAKTVMVIKRSMNPGFAGIDNELYYLDKTHMLFGDAKDFVAGMVKELTGGSGMH